MGTAMMMVMIVTMLLLCMVLGMVVEAVVEEEEQGILVGPWTGVELLGSSPPSGLDKAVAVVEVKEVQEMVVVLGHRIRIRKVEWELPPLTLLG
jgi:hypothetical protein